MNSEKLQHVQDENDLNESQDSEVDSSVQQTEEVLPGNPNHMVKPKACIVEKPCPTSGSPFGCVVC